MDMYLRVSAFIVYKRMCLSIVPGQDLTDKNLKQTLVDKTGYDSVN